jgi:CHAD domain-containing protein
MAYQLAADEPVDQGLRRICEEQLTAAISEMTDPALSRDSAVHQLRKRTKMIRAALRLVRPALGDTYDVENRWFRDEARRFSGARDAAVLEATLDGLAVRFAGEVRREMFAHVRDTLQAVDPASANGQVDDRQWDDVVADLGGARERVREWELSTEGFDAIGPGLEASYRRGRRAMRAAFDDPQPGNLHEFRKRAKDLWYQTRLIRLAWPDLLGKYRSAVHELADVLGDNQDLQVLEDTLPEADITSRDRLDLLEIVYMRRRELLDTAHPLAVRIYAEAPGAYAARMEKYWGAWWSPPGGEPSRS